VPPVSLYSVVQAAHQQLSDMLGNAQVFALTDPALCVQPTNREGQVAVRWWIGTQDLRGHLPEVLIQALEHMPRGCMLGSLQGAEGTEDPGYGAMWCALGRSLNTHCDYRAKHPALRMAKKLAEDPLDGAAFGQTCAQSISALLEHY